MSPKDKEMSRTIGKTLRATRIKARYTIEDLSGESGLNDKYIGEIERGEVNITMETLKKLSIGLKRKNLYDLVLEANEEYKKEIKELE